MSRAEAALYGSTSSAGARSSSDRTRYSVAISLSFGRPDALHDRKLLAEIELDAVVAVDPVAVLAEVLSCADLWSLPDTIAAAVNADPARVLGAGDLAGEFGRAAREMWTEDHERRLRFVVRRIADRAPEPGLTRVPGALAEACSTLEHDEDARLRIAGAMLWDALPDAAAYLAAAA